MHGTIEGYGLSCAFFTSIVRGIMVFEIFRGFAI